MKVSELMTKAVCTCGPDDNMCVAAQLMWENDCGALPVVDSDGRAIAMITDRDICMAAYTQGQPLASMQVSSAASHGLVAVHEDDGIDDAEAMMRLHQIRRVPVLDRDGRPAGILSMNDLALHARTSGRRGDGLSADSIVQTLADVCRRNGSVRSIDQARAT